MKKKVQLTRIPQSQRQSSMIIEPNAEDHSEEIVVRNQIETSPKRRNYSKGKDALHMRAALEEMKENPHQSVSKVAQVHDVSRKSLSDRIKGHVEENAVSGRKRYLSDEEEKQLENYLINMAELRFGYSLQNFKNLIGKSFKLIGKLNNI